MDDVIYREVCERLVLAEALLVTVMRDMPDGLARSRVDEAWSQCQLCIGALRVQQEQDQAIEALNAMFDEAAE